MANPWVSTKAQIIQTAAACISVALGIFNAWPNLRQTQLLALGAIQFYAVVVLVVASFWVSRRREQNSATGIGGGDVAPNIHLVEVFVNYAQGPATYPLKCLVQMRNDSPVCVDVQVSNYIADRIKLKKFVTGVLTVKLREWYPVSEGLDRVAVLPGQLFQAWVGVDETAYSVETVRELREHIGKLVLRVNGHPVEIRL